MSEILHHSPPAKETSHISSLSDYRPVVMKCFEKLVRSHITSLLPASFDSHQFAYRGNRSTEDTVATALHAALCHLEKQGSYVRTLFVDYSSVFLTPFFPTYWWANLRTWGFHTPPAVD
ncbi:hypothetical protein QTP86_012445 [Hemibagrus guttatus]|nr:hypothetical protein QTP86_012445 [Hemibagrus guttatus]